MTTRIKLRRDTAANWTTENPILSAGEPGLETDTGKVKYGDGTTAWSNLTYSNGGGVAENTRRGFINLTGIKPNNEDNVAFEAVAVHGDYAYVLGGADELVNNNSGLTIVYKYNLLTGEQVWVKKITSGHDATFSFSYDAETLTLTDINAAGIGYAVGEELYIDGSVFNGGNAITNLATVTVDTIDGDGGILTASVNAGWTPTGNTGTLTYIGPRNDNAYGDGNAIVYDEFTNEVLVVTEFSSGLGDPALDDFWSWTKITHLNPTTGAVVDTTLLTDEGDIYANSIKTYNKAGGIAIVGEKYGEYRTFGTLTMSATGNGYFDILKTELDAEHYPGAPYNNYYDFWITGTGISSMANVDNVNYYGNLTGTLRQGSGAVFLVMIDNNGSISLLQHTNGGSNYLPGHKIKLPYTAVGGSSTDQDIIITVTSAADGGVITGISYAFAVDGPATEGTYGDVTGTNYQVGSGAVFSLYSNIGNGEFSYGGTTTAGSGYVAGDVIVVDGTTFANGLSGTNDATVTIGAVDGGGALTAIGVIGTAPSTHLRINVDGVDFTANGGSWSMKQNLGGEAFIWTPDWSNAIGGPSGDRFYDVCWSADGGDLYAVGRGRYEVDYDQALVVKFNASTGTILWSKDIKFTEATDDNRSARAVCLVPGSTDIVVAGGWWNNTDSREELFLTRMTIDGTAVWTKTYHLDDGSGFDYTMNLNVVGTDIVVSLQHGTQNYSTGLGYLVFDEDGVLNRHRVLSADGNGNYNFWNTPTANFADIYSDATGDYVVMAGHTYVPEDNESNGLLVKLPLDGYKPLIEGYPINFAEHVFATITWNTATNTAAFESFTATEHVDTITTGSTNKVFVAQAPLNELPNHLFTITDDSAGYIEFGDGSKQAFATHIVPQIEAANDYYLTEQDSGKHIFFEEENGRVYIPHWTMVNLPVGFTFTIVNTTGSNCYVDMMDGINQGTYPGTMKLAGRDISTPNIGIPDSGSGSMVTFLKIKNGYNLLDTDFNEYRQDVWIVSGPGDVYDND